MLYLTRRVRESIRIGSSLLTVSAVDRAAGNVTVRVYGTSSSLGRSITLWEPNMVTPGTRRSAREFLPEGGDGVEVVLRSLHGTQCSIGIVAPKDVKILRSELEARAIA